jgi:outer membrane protein insertion porin family
MFGNDSYVRLSLDGSGSEWESDDYSAHNLELELGFGATPLNNLTYEVRLFARTDTLADLGTNISPLVTPDSGTSDAFGLGFNAVYSTLDRPVLARSGVRFGLDATLATPAGEREWFAWSASTAAALPIGSAVTLAFRAEGGKIEGRAGQDVSILDRAFLGSPDPRGFATAGIGPRDFVDGSVNTALGGKQYALGSLELRYQTPRPELTVGVFADAGSLWDLDQTSGGASGTIDDAYHLRTSAGLAVYWQTKIGLLTMSISEPISKEDYDQTETFAVGLRANANAVQSAEERCQ